MISNLLLAQNFFSLAMILLTLVFRYGVTLTKIRHTIITNRLCLWISRLTPSILGGYQGGTKLIVSFIPLRLMGMGVAGRGLATSLELYILLVSHKLFMFTPFIYFQFFLLGADFLHFLSKCFMANLKRQTLAHYLRVVKLQGILFILVLLNNRTNRDPPRVRVEVVMGIDLPTGERGRETRWETFRVGYINLVILPSSFTGNIWPGGMLREYGS